MWPLLDKEKFMTIKMATSNFLNSNNAHTVSISKYAEVRTYTCYLEVEMNNKITGKKR